MLVLLVGLLAFVALYVGLVVGLGYLLLGLWSLDVRGRAGVYLLIGGSVALMVPITFLIKGVFYREHRSREGMVEISRKDQPALFDFLDALVRETGAPRPRSVYLSAEVNAAVFYEPSILSLLLPAPKSLVLGLGLVNYLTVSELKAILGHELGHFSQRAMKLGSYVYVAQRVVVNLVFGRDGFDDMLEGAKRSDGRIAILAYAAAAVIGGIRFVLKLALEALTLGHRSLSREMEFAADRAAVAVAGADAIARGLYKAEVADACYTTALSRLVHAADQGLVTDDFFVHQTAALADLRHRRSDPTFGDATVRADGHLFAIDASTHPSMWATHPPSAERERAARGTGVTCAHDERPAWDLFTAKEATRKRVTQELLERALPYAKRNAARPAAELEAAFESERAHERRVLAYGEMYNGRHLAQLDLDALFARTPRERALLETATAELYGKKVERLSKDWRNANEELVLILRAQRGEVKRDALIVRGQLRAQSDVPELLKTCTDRMKAIDDAFAKLDQNVAEVHAELAISLGEDAAKKLRRRYAQCLRLARWQELLANTRQRALSSIGPIMKQREINADGVQAITSELGALGTAVAQVLKEAATKKPPRLPNVKKESTLAEFLLAQPPIGPFRDERDLGHWMRVTVGQADEVVDKLGRLHTHAVSQLLAEQERLRDVFARPTERDLPDGAASAPEEDGEA